MSLARAFVTSTGVRFELHEFGEGHERVFHGSWIWREIGRAHV